MSEMSEELLSALLDGECTPAEVEAALAAIERSPALKARWSRMCLTRDALAGVAIARPAFDLADSVMAALDAEPESAAHPKVVPLRPRAATPVSAASPASAAAVSARNTRWQRVAGLAVAASITAVVAIGGRSLIEQPVEGGVAATQAVASNDSNIVKVGADGTIIGTVPVAMAITETADEGRQWRDLDAATAARLNNLLIEHSNSPGSTGMGSALGIARLTVRAVDYRPADGSR